MNCDMLYSGAICFLPDSCIPAWNENRNGPFGSKEDDSLHGIIYFGTGSINSSKYYIYVPILINKLQKGIGRIEKHLFPAQNTASVAGMIDCLGRYSSFGFAMTQMKGSDAANVIPTRASVTMNLRVLGKETCQSVREYLQKTVKNDNIKFHEINGSDPSVESEVECEQWSLLESVIHASYPGTIVTPYLMMACSDSRHYGAVSNHVYRFSGMELSNEERKMIHGIDEQIPVAKMESTVEFYLNLIEAVSA